MSPLPPRVRSGFPSSVTDPDSIEQASDPISLDDVGPSMDESMIERPSPYDPYRFVDFRTRFQSSQTPERFLRQPERAPPAWVEQDLAAEEAEVVIPRKRVSERAPIEVDEAGEPRDVRLAMAVAGAVVAVVLAVTLWMLTF